MQHDGVAHTQLARQEVDGVLVVHVHDLIHGQPLCPVLDHVPFEYALVVVTLQLLIGQVDAELLEGVLLEVLEPKDVQQPDPVPPLVCGRGRQDLVEPVNDGVENTWTHADGQGLRWFESSVCLVGAGTT